MLLKLLGAIDCDSFDSMVVSLSGRGVMAERIEAAGHRVVSLGMLPGRFSLFRFFRLLLIIITFKPDLVQTWLYHADLLGGLAARLLGFRKVIWNVRITDCP